MRDLAFDIKANDKTQAAFDAAGRRAKAFGQSVDSSSRGVLNAAAVTDKLTAATDRYAAAARRAGSANDNWQRRNLMMQLGDAGQSLALGAKPMQVLLQQGPQIAQIWGPGEGGIGRAFRETGNMITGVIGKFPLLSAAAVAAAVGVAGLTYEINQVSDVSVSMGDTVTAVFQVIGSALYDQLQPAVAAIAPWFASAWDLVVAGTKNMGNNLVRLVIGSIEIIKFGIASVPDAFIVAGEAAANGFLSAIEQMAREALASINDLLTDINGMLPDSLQMPLAPAPMSVRFGRVDIGGAAARDRLVAGYADLDRRAGQIATTDYMGDLFDAVRQQAVANALGRVEKNANAAGAAMKKAANDNVDPWNGLREVSDGVAAAQKEAAREAERARDSMEQLGKQAGGILGGLINGTMSWQDALKQAIPLIFQLIDAMTRLGGMGLGGGGLITGLLGGLFGFAGGGYTGSGPRNRVAGLVHAGEYVFSQDSVRRIGIGNLEAMHRGVSNLTGPAAVQQVLLKVVGEPGPMFVPTIQAESRGVAVQVVNAGLAGYDRQLDRTIGGKVANARKTQF